MATADEISGNNARYAEGERILDEVHSEATRVLVEALQDVAPDLSRYVFEFAFGDIYARPNLELRERQLLTIVSLTSLGGCEAQLRTHITGALELGIDAQKVVETVMHCLPYAGFPRVLNAMMVVKEIFAARNILP